MLEALNFTDQQPGKLLQLSPSLTVGFLSWCHKPLLHCTVYNSFAIITTAVFNYRKPRHKQSPPRLCSVWYRYSLLTILLVASFPVKYWQAWRSCSRAEWQSCRVMALQLLCQRLTAPPMKAQLAYRYAARYHTTLYQCCRQLP